MDCLCAERCGLEINSHTLVTATLVTATIDLANRHGNCTARCDNGEWSTMGKQYMLYWGYGGK